METDSDLPSLEVLPVALPQEHRAISGFWRRSFASFLDGIVLMLVGLVLGVFLFDFFAQLGGWGRLLGFGLALLYFGLLNSTLGKGQTIGKRIMKIEVVDRNSHYIPLSRSFLRYTVLGVPFFLNGALIPPWLLMSPLGYIVGIVVFGLGGAILYLYIFNRPTRQSVHDLVAGTFVVKTSTHGEVGLTPFWRPHLIIMGICLFLLIASSLVISIFVPKELFSDLLAVQESIQSTGKVHTAGVVVGLTWGSDGKRTYVQCTAYWKKRPHNHEAATREIASIILREYPEVTNKDWLTVRVTYGYDLGIAQSWRWYSATYSPEEWQGILAETPAPD